MPRQTSYDLRILEQSSISEAGRQRLVLETRRPQSGDPASRQADLVREAARKGTSALIVVAEDPKTLAPALVEVRDRGVPIVLLGRPVAVPGKPITLVTLPSYRESARKIVAAAVEEAKNMGLDTAGQAVILINAQPDSDSAERVAAMEAALEEAGVALLERIKFGEGKEMALPGDAAEVVKAVATAHPRLAIILADDDNGLSGAVSGRYGLHEKGYYAVAGFATNPRSTNLVKLHMSAGVVNLNIVGEARQAVHTAQRLINGEKIPDQIMVESITRCDPATRPDRNRPQ
ncbi:MAG TPA: substrate-binding domain-containing protein [Isosphaeraceae bacterium]|nr:substrate-binding domain-containing protein [Isosphaeraceae bacterium]